MAYSVLLIAITLAYVFCLCFAIVSDFRTLIIPNWVPVALVSLFAPFAAMQLDWRGALAHVAVSAVVFAIALVFFLARWMGGGDVKLVTAVALWMGPEHSGQFTVIMALLGAILAVSLLLLRQYAWFLHHPWGQQPIVQRLGELAHAGECPYGVAIGVAALIAVPTMLWATT
jgi:prepilin peptidase CpaA